jgi:L-aminopeptidase/D-esterase-like protein
MITRCARIAVHLLITSVVASVSLMSQQPPPPVPATPLATGPSTDVRARGLTAVAGLAVGHFTLAERPTGCTVVLAESGAVAGVDTRGAAPGTRETDLLDPANTVDQVHAIVLSGGSAFGLDAAGGVMKFLEERGVGFDMRVVRVPIVPAAILYDLGVGDPKIRPTADCGYRAAAAATVGPIPEGNVGAGAGATVGKFFGAQRGMKGGLGTAALSLPNGIVVAALVAVNAVGDVIDPSDGKVVAGVRTPDGKGLADARILIRNGTPLPPPTNGGNTTLGVVATNARLTKAQATKLAQMAQDGVSRAIYPAHTPFDGDTMFALATGTRSQPVDLGTLGALGADAVSDAIVRAVRAATGIPGFPAARDLAQKK